MICNVLNMRTIQYTLQKHRIRNNVNMFDRERERRKIYSKMCFSFAYMDMLLYFTDQNRHTSLRNQLQRVINVTSSPEHILAGMFSFNLTIMLDDAIANLQLGCQKVKRLDIAFASCLFSSSITS